MKRTGIDPGSVPVSGEGDSESALARAVALYERGELAQAEALCRRIIETTPDNARALSQLGLVAARTGRPDEGVRLLRRAIELDPDSAAYHFNLGVMLRQGGDASAAIECYRRALALRPDMEAAGINLGNVLAERGQAGEAAQCYRRVLERNPRHVRALDNLYTLLAARGDTDDIIAWCRRLIERDPEAGQAYLYLGRALLRQQRITEAADAFSRALECSPGDAKVHFGLANAKAGEGLYQEAVEYYRKALDIDPSFVQARLGLGNAYIMLDRPEEAIPCYRRALEQAPGLADAYYGLGMAAQKMDRLEEAIAGYREALKLKPDHLLALCNMADIFEQTHRLDEAEQYCRKVFAIDPRHPVASQTAAAVARRRGDIEGALARLSAVPIPSGNDEIAQSLHFELGRLNDRAGASAAAFRHFVEANRIQAKSLARFQVDRDRYLENIRALRARFTPAWVASWQRDQVSRDRPAPVFLVGFPRSGTTLLDQILDSHPGIQVSEEKPVLANVLERLTARHGSYPDALAELDGGQIDVLRSDYYEIAERLLGAPPAGLFVDKLPLNIVHVGLIARLFPESPIILALRHPCDACLSCFMQPFKLNNAMAHFLSIEDTARLYDEVMGLWRTYAGVLPLRYHAMKYEGLVDDFESEVRRLLGFLGVEWDERVLDYSAHARGREKITTPSYSQVTEPIYQRARYRWTRYTQELGPVLELLRPHQEYFGY